MKTVLLVVNSEKSDLVVTENVHSIEETIIPVVEMTKNEAIGFVHLAETIILLSELNAIVAENQSEVTFRNVAAPSETTVADAETTVVEEDATIADLVTKNNIIEMTGFVLHVRMTTSLSELNATNVESLDREEALAEEIHVEATEEVATAADAMVDVEATEEVATAADAMVTVADVEATEEVASVADAMGPWRTWRRPKRWLQWRTRWDVADVEATEEVATAADAMETVADVEATEEVASVADAMETVADVEATEEVAPVADAMVTVVDVEATEEVAPVADAMESVADVEMTVQTNSIERPVENDLAMLTIDHLRKSSHVDINDAMTMTTKVNI